MVTIEEILVHPLFLLLVGAGVSSLLIPWFTNKWQDHRKKLDIKVDITSKMSEVIVYQLVNANTSLIRRKKTLTDAEEDAYYEDWRKWHVDVNIISSKLEIYFLGADIRQQWDYYILVLGAFRDASQLYFYEAPSEAQKKILENALKQISAYMSDITVPSETLQNRIRWSGDRIATSIFAKKKSLRETSLSKGDLDREMREIRELEERWKAVIDGKDPYWDRLSTEMTYDEVLWTKVGELLNRRAEEIISDTLKLPIKVF